MPNIAIELPLDELSERIDDAAPDTIAARSGLTGPNPRPIVAGNK